MYRSLIPRTGKSAGIKSAYKNYTILAYEKGEDKITDIDTWIVLMLGFPNMATAETKLLRGMREHLDAAVQAIPKDERDPRFITQVKKTLPKVPQQLATTFLKKEARLDVTLTRHLGNSDIERHGVTIGSERPSGHAILLRFYTPTGLSPETAAFLSNSLAASDHSSLHRPSTHDTSYYAAAEIMTRTMAHVLSPKEFPLPTALVDKQRNPVGFVINTGTLVDGSKDYKWHQSYTGGDVVRHLSGRGFLYNPDPHEAHPAGVETMYSLLYEKNIVPYIEKKEDATDMLLFSGDNFYGFNRIAYFVNDK